MSSMSSGYLAIDLGAESGRVIVGVLENDRLRLEEVHRFLHEPVWLPTGLHWNISGIWREIVVGLRQAAEWAKANRVELVSVGVDTWGVDWALVDKAGELVGIAACLPRSAKSRPPTKRVVAKLGTDRIYRTTGIQFMPLNSLYSLYAHKLADPQRFRRCRSTAVHSRFDPLLAQRRADDRSHDRLDQPDDRLPHRRLGPRHGRGTRFADEHFGTDHRAGDDDRHAATAACRKRPACRQSCASSPRPRTIRRAPSRRCPRSNEYKLVLSVQRHLVAVGRGAHRAVRLGRRPKPRRSRMSSASTARFDS